MSRELISKTANKSIYRDGDKIYKEFVEGFPKDEVFNEAFINSRVEAILGQYVPKVLSVECIDGKWTMVREYIDGETLEELIKKNSDKKEEYLSQMLDLQLKLHNYQAPKLRQIKDKMKRQINELNGIDEGTRFDLLSKLAATPLHRKLCHGDFRPSNIIVDNDGNYHIIDWVHATKGNASADIARTYLILALSDQESADWYLKNFCERTKTSIDYVQNWLPLVAAAQLTKHREEEQALLERWTSICDYT
ncbi:MAG: aminoglycoside phosphotransferase family protein [Eubacteriales bacterium]|nr:aminoglycoside phosphotransferase family protein [Eubacteriales bacterium]